MVCKYKITGICFEQPFQICAVKKILIFKLIRFRVTIVMALSFASGSGQWKPIGSVQQTFSVAGGRAGLVRTAIIA